MRFETLAVHAGASVDPVTRAITPPIHLSTTFERAEDGAFPGGYIYTRSGNPTRLALEECLTALEGGAAAAAFASGSAATAAIFQALQPGDHVIDEFTFVYESHSEHGHLKDLRGKAVAVAFIYARCPLPDFCIRMSTNFSDAAHKINDRPELKSQMTLLTISFDPENDTPAKLRSYGLGYMGKDATDLGVWQLATGSDTEIRKIADFFGLRYEVDPNDKTKINHSLRTIVIAPSGKVTKVFAGNNWTVAQLLDELNKALATQEN